MPEKIKHQDEESGITNATTTEPATVLGGFVVIAVRLFAESAPSLHGVFPCLGQIRQSMQ